MSRLTHLTPLCLLLLERVQTSLEFRATIRKLVRKRANKDVKKKKKKKKTKATINNTHTTLPSSLLHVTEHFIKRLDLCFNLVIL